MRTFHLKSRHDDDFLRSESEISATRDDLVVTRAELDRFEKAYEVSADVVEPNGAHTTIHNNFISFCYSDRHHSRFIESRSAIIKRSISYFHAR